MLPRSGRSEWLCMKSVFIFWGKVNIGLYLLFLVLAGKRITCIIRREREELFFPLSTIPCIGASLALPWVHYCHFPSMCRSPLHSIIEQGRRGWRWTHSQCIGQLTGGVTNSTSHRGARCLPDGRSLTIIKKGLSSLNHYSYIDNILVWGSLPVPKTFFIFTYNFFYVSFIIFSG